MDILFKNENYIFSYRIAGICINNGKILLQNCPDDTGFAFPGGHVEFGETNEETLIRELKEEIDADIKVHELKWVAEIFFPWDDKPCHQICLYYMIEILNKASIPLEGKFTAHEQINGREFNIEYHWVPLEEVNQLEIYPTNAVELLQNLDDGVKHFIYKENEDNIEN